MTDIFNNTVSRGGSFRKTDKGGFAFSGAGAIGLVQSWNVQYTQNIQPLYEVGSGKIYFSGSAQAGTMTIERIVGGSKQSIVELLGTLCNPKSPRIVAAEDCDSGEVTLEIESCVVSSVTWSGQAANAYVAESVQAQFIGLKEK